jgi:hypothetical protein
MAQVMISMEGKGVCVRLKVVRELQSVMMNNPNGSGGEKSVWASGSRLRKSQVEEAARKGAAKTEAGEKAWRQRMTGSK